METELNDLQTATQAWGFNRRRQKNKNQSNVAGCALVGANGFIEPTGAESNEFEESKSDNARITISRNTFRAKDSMTTETNYNNGAEEYHSTAGLSTSDSDVGYEPGQTTQTEPHLIQQSEPKSEPIMSRNTENKNSHGDVDDHSSANENENDSQGNQPESVPTSNSFAAGYTRTEPLPEKAPPKISKPNFVVSSSRDKSYINLNKFIVSSFGNQPSTPQKPRAYSNVSSRYLSETNVIRQTEKSFLPGDKTAWQSLSMMARNRARQRGAAVNEDCVISILCLDISESMAGDAWNQVKTFTKDFLEGLTESKASAPHIRDEYVGVATFGHKTELSVLLTKNFEEVGRHIDGISLGGPTPLYGGLMMALAGAMSSDNEIGPCINGIRAYPKIIVLTDGYPTELMLNAGPDVADESEIEQTMAQLTEAVQFIDGQAKSVFFVGVGKYNENFINTMSSLTGPRKQYTFADGRRIARRSYLISERESVGMPFHRPVNRSGPSKDEEDLQDAKDDYMRRIGRSRQHTDDTQERENTNTTLPRVGSRVRRGPEWRWGNQDGEGPGTVVQHSDSQGQVSVTWDHNGQTGIYNYDEEGFEVITVDEPRRLKPGEKIAVGCTVKPGLGNKAADLKSWNTGVVLRKDGSTVLVRWDSGKRVSYKINTIGKPEIEVCSSFQGQGHTLGGCCAAENANTNNSNSTNSACNTSSATSVIKKNKNT